MTPTLRSLRLILSPYTALWVRSEHIEWLNNRDHMQFSEQRHRLHTVKSQIEFARSIPPDSHVWVVRCGATDVGTISAHSDKLNQVANMGILIGPNHLGHGFGQEAWATVMEWLFDEGAKKVEAGCRADNAPMRRLALATGMAQEAIIPGHYRVGDERRDLVLYGRFCDSKSPSEWDTMWREPFWRTEVP